jgi:hypothetical protein
MGDGLTSGFILTHRVDRACSRLLTLTLTQPLDQTASSRTLAKSCWEQPRTAQLSFPKFAFHATEVQQGTVFLIANANISFL